MRIHSDKLCNANFQQAAYTAGVRVIDLTEHGSHSRLRAFNFTLSGSGQSRSQWAASDHQAATWDEWGIVFNHLFEVDPLAHCLRGKYGYQNAEHFHWVTGGRFRDLTPLVQHKRHKFDDAVDTDGPWIEWWCDCGAIQRWMMQGHDFAELAMS